MERTNGARNDAGLYSFPTLEGKPRRSRPLWPGGEPRVRQRSRASTVVFLVLAALAGLVCGVALPGQSPAQQKVPDAVTDAGEQSTWWGMRPVLELLTPRFDMPLLEPRPPMRRPTLNVCRCEKCGHTHAR